MSAQAIIKSQAREKLRRNYPTAVIALITALLPVYVIDGTLTAILCLLFECVKNETVQIALSIVITYPVLIIAGILLSPVINGYIRVYYLNAIDEGMDIRQLFYYFHAGRYAKALSLNLMYLVRMLLPTLLLFSPVVVYYAVITSLAEDFYGTVLYNDIFFILFILSSITTTLYSLKYFTVYTLSVEMEQIENKALFGYSTAIMKDKTLHAAKLIFSFTPWMLMCLTVLPMLYVIPYMTESLCIGAKWMTRATYEVK